MIIKLLDYAAFFVTRDPLVKKSTDAISFVFEEVPQNCVAIFTTEDNISYYREIANGECRLNVSHIGGCVDIRIKRPATADTAAAEWICESFVVTTTPGGYQVVTISEKSIRQTYLDNLLRIDKLRKTNEDFEKRIIKLETLVEEMKGYEL
jgi:hypothetical protein